jgi:hypothetical protein
MSESRLLVEALYSYGGDREDRLTEVLASVLEVNSAFCRRFAKRVGLRGNPPAFTVETQFGPPGHRRLVDLVLRGTDLGGNVVATVFAEHKYNPEAKLEGYWFDPQQAARQRDALTSEPGEQVLAGVASKADLERLDGPAETRPSFDPRDAYDAVISWTDVKELAQRLAREEACDHTARSGVAPSSARMLAEFLAYLELEGDSMGALGNDDLFVLGRIGLAEDRVDRLLKRATDLLPELLGPISQSDELTFESDEDNSTVNGYYYFAEPAEGNWLDGLRDAALFVGVDFEEEAEEVNTPFVYAGIGWTAGREAKKRISGSKWETAIRQAGFDPYWDKYALSVSARRPLLDISEAGKTIAQQATHLAEWAHQSIHNALKLPAAPNVDEEDADDEAT